MNEASNMKEMDHKMFEKESLRTQMNKILIKKQKEQSKLARKQYKVI